ncbi:fasciclin domain-containing protein [Hymenobacter sp. BT664]|uniref:Fasciclin domain-containing protein n=1 Tax=Hymenobacter montanus TaxID=2771359 RepID=A0A927GLG0_9BACT|nr:fasciclin domain-containing protein [Hymenobacter montanus]MBD2770156.1 fasciclin domain-containing protein [Hymenobacter montanus]
MVFSHSSLLSFRRLSLVLVALFGFAATSCKDDKDDPQPAAPQNIVQVAQANPDFSILVAAVTKANLASTLSGTGPFTVFAPTNAAFTRFSAPFNSAANINAITDPAQIATLRDYLLYHVLAGNKKAADLSTGPQTTLKTAGATTNIINLTKTGNTITINGSTTVVTADVAASNGTIHAIDNVLVPANTGPGNIVQVAQDNTNFSVLVAAVTKADLAGTLSGTGPFTVLAPTNAAFAMMPAPFNTAAGIAGITDPAQIATLRSILLYHVLPGRKAAADFPNGASAQATAKPASAAGVNDNTVYASKAGSTITLNGTSRVVTADVAASNGIIHAIDKVLMPPTRKISELVVAATSGSPAEFTLLLAALQRPAAADLLAAAANPASNVTVFAPTDAAFRALFTQLGITSLSEVTDATLLAVLRLHIVGSRAFSSDLSNGSLTTLGGSVTVGVSSSGVTVRGGGNGSNNANVTIANQLATNGVVHVIDRVLLP